MRYTGKIGWIAAPIGALALAALFVTVLGGSETKEIVVTLGGLSSEEKAAAFARAEGLREEMQFREAIAEYRKVAEGGEVSGLEAEALYNIGLCRTWLGQRGQAEQVFQQVLERYASDGEATAYAQYCLAWVDIQKRDFAGAVARLQRVLNEKTCEDSELYARAQFQIGRIYLAFVHDYEKAQAAFQKVLADYPDSKAVQHPFLDPLRTP